MRHEEQQVELSGREAEALREEGYAVIRGPIAHSGLCALSRAYDAAVAAAEPCDIRHGSTSTRVTDFVTRSPEFDSLYLHGPLLHACCLTIRQPFRLSTVHARTLRPGTAPGELHVDFASDTAGWPMLGFIYMVDEFRPDNGATLFLPGSQGTPAGAGRMEAAVPACGPAGSMIVYNGSVWHEHGRNGTATPRRSIQGAFLRRSERGAMDWRSRAGADVRARLSPLACYLLDL